MNLIYKLDLDIPKMQLRAKMKFLGQGFQKLEQEQTDRTTDAHDRKHYHAEFAGCKYEWPTNCSCVHAISSCYKSGVHVCCGGREGGREGMRLQQQTAEVWLTPL